MDDLRSLDKDRQNRGYAQLLEATREPVTWAYEVWDDLLRTLTEGDNRQRSIAAQVLSNLAKSDPERRMLRDFERLLNVTRDERFVTARHALLSLWEVALAGPAQREIVVTGLTARFEECGAEKNCTLIRYDILEVLRRIYDGCAAESLRGLAERLIAQEPDLKYRKKYGTLWRKAKQDLAGN